jgi:glucose/arabinose dehydrogenase
MVGEVRAGSSFPTYEKLLAAAQFRPLPQAPSGFEVSELARLPDFATRMAGDRSGKRLYVLGQQGTIWSLEVATRKFTPIVSPTELSGDPKSACSTLGLTLDDSNRLWMTVNQRVPGTPWVSNQVSIYRTTSQDKDGNPVHPKLWFRTAYPYGVGPYNHGVSQLRFGSDGMLYVSSGSRTDGGEPGLDANLGKMGETEITSSLWRLDPRSDSPHIEVIARGIRNAYSFNWDGSSNLFTVSNGPDAPAAEEMDFIQPSRSGERPEHHGFPYQFADEPASRKWYPHTPSAPPGQEFVLPVLNLGPDGLLDGEPTSTFTPHSSPAGLEWVGNEWPEPYRNVFFMGRFGNLIRAVHDQDTGFDILALHLERRQDGRWTSRTQKFLAPLGRPIDLHIARNGHLYVLEYTRATDFNSQAGWLPGRILDVHPVEKTVVH